MEIYQNKIKKNGLKENNFFSNENTILNILNQYSPNYNMINENIEKKPEDITLDENLIKSTSPKKMTKNKIDQINKRQNIIKNINMDKLNAKKSSKNNKNYTLIELKKISNELGIKNLTGIKKTELVKEIKNFIKSENN